MAKAFIATLFILLSVAAVLIYRTGVYKEVQISSGDQGPFVLVYKVHKGPYHKIVAVISEVEDYFFKNDLACPMAFGLYLHDPNQVEQDRLTSHGGCVFTNLSKELQEVVKDSNYEIEVLEKKEYLVATFDGSPSLGPIRVYPKVDAWMAKYGYKRKGSVLELYQTMGEDKVLTRYLFEYE